MKKSVLAVACVLGFAGMSRAATVSINIDAGALQNATGTAVVPTGGLLQLLASSSGTFSAPTSASYVSGDNVLVTSFAMNMVGGTGETNNALSTISLSTSNYTLTTGEALELRFYPSLTFASMPAAPTLGTTFGQVRSSTIEFGSAGGVANETAWVVPSAGTLVGFEYVTASNTTSANAYANNTAFATGIVLAGVPEPSTYAIVGCGILGLVGLRMRNRRIISQA